MTYEIEVTAEDIQLGQAASEGDLMPPSQTCAIARALSRYFRKPLGYLGWWYTHGYDNTTEKAYPHGAIIYEALDPDKVQAFVMDHDDKKPVEPFTLVIRDV